MNRRTALMLSMFLGGLVPPSLLAQQARRKRVSGARDRALEPVSSTIDDPDAPTTPAEPSVPFPSEPGFRFKEFNIARYTRIATNEKNPNPQKSIIDWIFRRTGTTDWHGEQMTVLSANRSKLRVYNSPDVLKQVEQIVERFTNAYDDTLSVRVQFIAAVDTRWRYSVFSRLTPVGGGPQGQQIWTMKLADAALILSQMQIQQGFRKLADQRIEMINGQTLTFRSYENRNYAGGIQRDGAAGLIFQPRVEKIEENIVLKLSPLLTFEGDGVDAMIDLSVNMVRALHKTKIIAPRDIGPSEVSIDVPEATQTHLDQTVKNWPLNQTLLISAGIHPGILEKKTGWFNLPIPGTYPTGTEVLIFLDVETVNRGRTARAIESRSRLRDRVDDDPRARDDAASPEERDPDR